MGKRARRQFTIEFKQEAVKLARETGNVAKVARDLDLYDGSLREWIRQAEEGKIGAKGAPLAHSEREELERLRRENKRLQMERDFLKKATAFFAKEQK
jgi:transposase